ncbi:MAG TPA: YdeI/OmpD-associated family protein [Flavipsychrobacter sp.]|nr:YdeI/OmpD-associated family protein [Flavipsychrobacter sp.]
MKSFKTQKEFETWIAKNHERQEGILLLVYKKDSGIKSITIQEALDVALCWGWIDGIRKSHDEVSYIQKYTPRRKKSIWSKINVANVERLAGQGKMQPAGWAEVEKAKADGRWEKAYESQRDMQVPEDFIKAVSEHEDALAFFEGLSKQNKFAIAFRLHNIKKQETRERKIKEFVTMMKEERKFH